jgi:hypothetical protein
VAKRETRRQWRVLKAQRSRDKCAGPREASLRPCLSLAGQQAFTHPPRVEARLGIFLQFFALYEPPREVLFDFGAVL